MPSARALRLAAVAGAALVAAVVVAVGGGPGGPRPAREAPPVANLWVDPTGGACARRAAATVHADGRACGSFADAYAAARDGDLVLVRNPDGGDDYGPQTIPDGAKDVTIRSDRGKAEIGHTVVSAANVRVEDLVIENRGTAEDTCGIGVNGVLASCGPGATYDGVEVDGLSTCSPKRHGVRYGGDGFTFRNGEVRNVKDEKGMEIAGRDIVIDRVWFHDIVVRNECAPDVHNECLFVQAAPRMVIRDSRFDGCPTMAIYFTNWETSPDVGGATYSGYVLENNVVGYTLDASGNRHDGCAVDLGSFRITEYRDIKVRYNTFDGCVGADPAVPDGGGNEMVGNAGAYGCFPQFAYRHNVGDGCTGPGEVRVEPSRSSDALPGGPPEYGWVDAAAFDYRVRAGSRLVGAGDPEDFPAADRRGIPRASPPTAGAYEQPR